MRTWLEKSDNTAPAATGVLTAAEDNARAVEANNLVLTAGLSLDATSGPDVNLKMMSESVARYASGGVFYTDGGAGNVYVLTTPSGTNGFVMPKAYFHGMCIAFWPGAANTGPSTVNVNGIGSKKLMTHTAAAMAGGEIVSGRLIVAFYDISADTSNGAFRLAPWANAAPGASTQVNSDWAATSGVAQILNKPIIPTITPQINADWDATSGAARILNKPSIPSGQVNADWNASSGVAQILNKPSFMLMPIQWIIAYIDTNSRGRVKVYTSAPSKTTTWATIFPSSSGGPGSGYYDTIPPGITTGAFLAGPSVAIGNMWELHYNTDIGPVATLSRNDTSGVVEGGGGVGTVDGG